MARVASFMPRYLMTEDTPYTRAVGAYTWTAMAARLLVPGAKVDMVPIWLGGQGVRKSSAVCEMVPDVAQFVEINLESRDDNLARSLRGKLVGELGELRGLSGRDSEEIKAWITRQHEEWVPKYKEFTTKFPRRCVFIGTTNQQEFLVDPTGNRRWLPVRVAVTAPHIDVDGIGADRAQLWAEAAVLFKAGGVAWRDAEDLARGVHADHMVRDSWEESVSAWLDEVDPFTGDAPRSRDFLRVGEVLAGAVKVDPKAAGQREQKRMAALLSSMGYSRKKVRADGRVQWVYALA